MVENEPQVIVRWGLRNVKGWRHSLKHAAFIRVPAASWLNKTALNPLGEIL